MATNYIHPAETAYSVLEHFYPNDETARVRADIVLVAGLGGHHVKSWEASDGCCWPWHLLPNQVPHIRVRSFRYTTTIYGTTNRSGIRQHAADLLNKLRDDREDDEAATVRPIVFIGHSIGGMIIKQAIGTARKKLQFRSLWEASRGIMFFATPQWGMDEAAWPLFAERVLRCNAPEKDVDPTETMVTDIKINSQTLYKISQDFKAAQRQLAFVSFVEGNPMEGASIVLVTEAQGLIHDVEREYSSSGFMSGDHLGLCKFGYTDGNRFRPVWDGVEWLINQKPKQIDQLSPEQRKALYFLCPEEFNLYSLGREPTEGTCAWIVQRPELRDWLDGKPGKQKLWIHSQPGGGKSFLAKHIIANMSTKSHEVVHCFMSNSTPARGDLQSLMRATLHQALRLEPAMIRELLRHMPEDFSQQGSKMWTRDILTTHWPGTMAKIAANHPLVLVVDGLDELESECRVGFLSCLQQAEKNIEELRLEKGKVDDTTGPRKPCFSILLLSRKDAELARQLSGFGFNEYAVTPMDTAEDVKKTVSTGLGKMWSVLRQPYESPGSREELDDACRSITETSSGSYLWATLVVEYLARAPMAREIHLVLLVRELPRKVQDLYRHMIQQVNSIQHISTFFKQVMRWALFQNAGLRPAEFNIAQALGMAIEPNSQNPTDTTRLGALLGNTRTFENSLDDNIKIRVDLCCGHLFRFRNERLEFAHGSLRSFLLAHGAELVDNLDPDLLREQASHAILADICIAYLNMAYFSNSGAAPTSATMDMWESKVRKRIQEHAFVRYSALNWHKHKAKAGLAWPGANAKAALDRMKRLLDGSTEHAKSWAEVWWFCTKGPTVEYPSEYPGELILAYDSETPTASLNEESPAAIASASEDTQDVSCTTSRDIAQPRVGYKKPSSSEKLDIPVEPPPREPSTEDTARSPERQEAASRKDVTKNTQQGDKPQRKLPPVNREPPDPGRLRGGPVPAVPEIHAPKTPEKPPKLDVDENIPKQVPTTRTLPLIPKENTEVKRLPAALLSNPILPRQAIPGRISSSLQHEKSAPQGGMRQTPSRLMPLKPMSEQAIPEEHSPQRPRAAEQHAQSGVAPKQNTPAAPVEKKKDDTPEKLKREEQTKQSFQMVTQTLRKEAAKGQTKREGWWTRVKKAGKGLAKEAVSLR